ncbi:response regulator transcription factor [soil metagenome]
MTKVVLGSPGHTFRLALAAALVRHPDIRVVAATGEPERLGVLAANSRCSLVVLDACWLRSSPRLIGQLAAGPAPPRILLFADSLATPEVLAAVQQGVHGCLSRDSELEVWHRAILAIDAGETWVPRGIMSEALANLVQQNPGSPAAAVTMAQLTERQREITNWVAHGLSNKEIGKRLNISPTTVKTHMHNIFERVGVQGRHQLAAQALKRA